jgi:hypothetical protein
LSELIRSISKGRKKLPLECFTLSGNYIATYFDVCSIIWLV